MPVSQPKRIVAGFRSLLGGVNSSLDPALLNTDQVAWATNTTFRGSMATCRPGWRKVALTFESPTTQAQFEDGLFQGASFFQPYSGQPLIVCQSGGHQLFIPIAGDLEVTDMTIGLGTATPDPNTTNQPLTWWCQAEDWLILQDGLNAPIAILPGGLRRMDSAKLEVPSGTCMSYTNGRLWVAMRDGRAFAAGDLVGSSSGTGQFQYRDAVLRFTENDYLSEGGLFGMPTGLGRIRAMREIASMDTALGEGALQVFGEHGVISVNAPTDRESWKAMASPLVTVTQVGYGASGQESTVNVNADIFYRSQDGIRSYFMAARSANENWFQRPISSNIDRVLNTESAALLDHSSAVYWNNRLLITAQPAFESTEVYFKSLIALDFNPISSFGSEAQPAWEGVWYPPSGYHILRIIKGLVNGVDRCWVFMRNGSNTTELWEITKDAKFDNDGTGDEAIDWTIETAAYSFNAATLKQLDTAKLWHDRITGTVSIALQLRPNQYPCWFDWGTASQCANYQTCTVSGTCPDLAEKREQYRIATSFGSPPETCDTLGNRPAKFAYEWQVKLSLTGFARLRMLALFAYQYPDDIYGECHPEDECVTLECCDSD